MSKSKIFLYLSILLIAGIALRSFFDIPFIVSYIILLLGIIITVLAWRYPKVRFIGLGGIFLFLGILRFEISLPKVDEGKIQFYNEKEKITFIGTVSQEPDMRGNHVKLTVNSKQLTSKDPDQRSGSTGQAINNKQRKVSGKVLVGAPLYPQYQYGDELEISCSLKKPEKIEDFDYERYLGRYNIYSTCYWPKIKLLSQNNGNRFYNFIISFKGKLKQVVNSGLAEPQASILSAMLLGSRRGIPQELIDKFSQTGTSHIIAISGLHITIISAILMSLALGMGLSRKKAFYFAVLFLTLFIIMIGMPSSAVRAGIMGFLVLWAMKIGRLNRATNALVLAACLMLLINPKILRGDVGFQLSFLAVLGLIFISPFLKKWFKKFPESLGIRSSMQMTISAQVATFPLIIFSFHRLSFVAPLTNILILPILPFVMISGFIASFSGLIWLPLAKLLFLPVWLLITYLIKVIEIFASLPFSYVEIKNLPGILLAVIYSLMIWGIYRTSSKLKVKS